MHAVLGCRRIENELRFPVLLLNRVIVRHYNRAVSFPSGDPDPKHNRIRSVRQNYCRDGEQKHAKHYPPHPPPQVVNCERRHDARL
jgi:hypothetical protein